MTHELFPEPVHRATSHIRKTVILTATTGLIAAAAMAGRIFAQHAGLAAWDVPLPALMLAAVATIAIAVAWVRPRATTTDAMAVTVLLAVSIVFMELTLSALPLTFALSIILGTQPWRKK